MYLKRLEMYGFKSFADKTVLEFMPGITTVIGPNGSGKSNISDCIRWILGEQSIKSLRGNKSEDIIFAGTQNRRSLGFAEGTLVFDNSDGKLPIEYMEVSVTRKIYRSGESGYFINKVPCRLKDILELFMDTGIGRDGYSIIGQGKIDEILSNKSEDRRYIFEEAAGIVKYRTRKEESEKKLEQTKVNLLRINDIISEIETTIGPLKEQSEKARKFLDLREELKDIEVGLFLYNIDEIKEKMAGIKDNVSIFETQKVKEEEKLSSVQLEKENIKIEIEKLLTQIENTQNLGFESEKKKEQYNSEINIAKERITSNNENFDRFDNEIKELNEKNVSLEEEKTNKIEKKNNLLTNKEKFDKELKEKEAELEKYTKTLSEKELEIEGKKQVIENNNNKKYELVGELNTEKANIENIEKRVKLLNSEIQNYISELDKTRTQKDELLKSFYEIEKNRNTLAKELEKAESDKAEISKKISEYDSKINDLNVSYKMKEARHNFLVETEREKEGYSKSVKSILSSIEKNNELKKGVKGVLANLISVDSKYETAIEIALGASIQNIVTETEEEAKKLIQYLRDNNLGRASFLPISTIKGTKITSFDKRNIDGVIGIASDLIETNAQYEEIVKNLLGRTVIVDNINNAVLLAKKNKYGFKIVTLEGDVINPSGAISGGSIQKKTVNILGRGKEIKSLENELKKIEKEIAKLENEKIEYQNGISKILESFDEKVKTLQEAEIIYATEKQKQDAINLEISKQESRLEKAKINIENLHKEKDEHKNNQEMVSKQMKELDEETASLEAVIKEFTETNKENQKYIDDLNFEITNLKISVSSFDESGSSIDEMVERINKDIGNNLLSIENKNKLKDEIKKTNKELEEKIVKINEDIKKLLEDVSHSSEKVQKLREEKDSKNEKLKSIEEDISKQSEIIDDVKNQLSKLDVKFSKLDLELNQYINKMWEEYELTPNNTGEIKKISNPTVVQKNVNELRNQIKELGSVNIDSIKEYKELKERYDFMSEQRLDLEESSTKLKKIISEMTSTMKEQFTSKFKTINKNFGEVFKELFGGGKATLILEDESNVLECGIEIQAQPPGKKLQNMMLLSGGEKAFTAIALLFAILKINPSPFCVLDEIEAALDDVNVFRFADYLKKFVSDTQFLVITHRKGTMEAADTVYGITMEEKGISKLLSMKLKN